MENGREGLFRRPRRALLTGAFYLLVLVFLGYFLRDVDWSGLSSLDPSYPFLVLALPVSLLVRFLQPLTWAALIRDYGEEPPPYPALTLVYAKSWLGRYIPGKVAWIGSKVLFGSRHGVKKGVLAVTSVLEAGINLGTGLGVSLLLLAVTGETARIGQPVRISAAVAFVAVAVALAPGNFNAVIARMHVLAKGRQLRSELRLSNRAFRQVVGYYLGIHALGAVSVYLVLKAAYPALLLAHLPYVAAASLLAGAIGSLVLIAPSGLGVREGLLIALLAPVMPTEVAVVSVVFLRLWSVTMDLSYYGLATTTAGIAGRHRRP